MRSDHLSASDAASRRHAQRHGYDRMPKAHILVTILFTSLAWFFLDLILFASQTETPNNSGKLPIPDPYHHSDIAKRAAVAIEQSIVDKPAPPDDKKMGMRKKKLQKWRNDLHEKNQNLAAPDSQVGLPDEKKMEGLGNHAVKRAGIVPAIKVENDNVVHHILLDKPEERPKSFEELHENPHKPVTTEKQTTKTTTTTTPMKPVKMGDFNKFMKGWKEEQIDQGDFIIDNNHRNVVDDLMNKIGHNAKAVLENHAQDIIQFDHPWVQFGDDVAVPTEKPLQTSTKSTVKSTKSTTTTTTTTQPPVTVTEALNFTLIRKYDVRTLPGDGKGVGEGGGPVFLSPAEEALSKQTWTKNHFSVYVSDKISLERNIRDIRPPGCDKEKYPYRHLPRTSIIICFTDEAWSTLLRSVHSVLNRSPPELVEEIILVDDFSQKEYLKQKLDDYIRTLPKVKILRMSKREGLIRARLRALEVATAPVVTYLDSHIECCVGWLEPLMERIRLNPRAVPCPVIDTINDHSFHYTAADANIRGGFTWAGLMFRWVGVPQYEMKRLTGPTDAVRSPTMAGGLFSIRKDYFYELGTYDPGLQIWGGENIELSLKIWMCGGTLEIVPCSHVGHVFRSRQPYSFPGSDNISMFLLNSLRVATVWLDDYLESFFLVNPRLRNVTAGNITARLDIKKKLKCHDFDWYHKNVYPELFVPGTKLQARGQLKNSWTKGCFDSKGGISAPNSGVGGCHGLGGNQLFRLTVDGSLENYDKCIGAPDVTAVRSIECHYPDQIKWTHKKGGQIVDSGRGLCLHLMDDRRNVHLVPCKENLPQQQWTFDEYR